MFKPWESNLVVLSCRKHFTGTLIKPVFCWHPCFHGENIIVCVLWRETTAILMHLLIFSLWFISDWSWRFESMMYEKQFYLMKWTEIKDWGGVRQGRTEAWKIEWFSFTWRKSEFYWHEQQMKFFTLQQYVKCSVNLAHKQKAQRWKAQYCRDQVRRDA